MTTPKKTRKELIAMIKAAHPGYTMPQLCFVGIRGYYLDSMGADGKNDRSIYDDALFILGKDEMIAFNGNTDPSVFKPSIATLKPGIWPAYKFDLHKGQYLALCQRAAPVTVLRDGRAGEFTGMFGINIHRGGINGTSSEGCQTIPASQFGRTENCGRVIVEGFMSEALALAKKYYGTKSRDTVYTYILLENTPALNNAPDTNG